MTINGKVDIRPDRIYRAISKGVAAIDGMYPRFNYQ